MKISLAFGGLLVLLSGCGGGSATVTPNLLNSNPSSRYDSATLLTPFQRWVLPPLDGGMALRTTPQVGQTTATSITSLQYYLQSIQLCENITVNGTGYSGTSGCSYLYTNVASQDLIPCFT